jgi:hypothetical protein
MAFFEKQHSSRIIKSQVLGWTGTGTVISTNFSSETFQIRVNSQVGGYFAVDNLGTLPTTAGATGTLLSANVEPEFVTVTPGMLFSFSSTSTSSGTVGVSELA